MNRVEFQIRLVTVTVLSCMFISGIASSAEITWDDGTVIIFGEIEEGDYKELVKWYLAFAQFGPAHILRLGSSGGDVAEAMRIGRFVRTMLITSIVSSNQPCNSSCFLIHVAGAERFAFGPVGLHRPFYDQTYFAGLPPEKATAKYEELDQEVRSYLREMEVPSQLVERMFATRSSQIDPVSADEMNDALDRNPPSLSEWLIANCGDMTDREWHEFASVQAWDFALDIQSKDPSPGSAEAKEDEEWMEWNGDLIRRAETLSTGYRKYLRSQGDEIDKCHHETKTKSRLAAIEKFKTETDIWKDPLGASAEE